MMRRLIGLTCNRYSSIIDESGANLVVLVPVSVVG